MNKIPGILLIVLLIASCQEQSKEENNEKEKIAFNQQLADELKAMAEVDQIAAFVPQGKYKDLSEAEWKAFKDSVFTTHQERLKEMFDEHGFVGFDLAGEEGSHNFWLMVQHSDHNPVFQKEVLEKMKAQVESDNAVPSDFGLLTDRVRLNTGQKQVYGTQLTYNTAIGQAYPKPLEDSLSVNERRKSIGLEPIEVYLNSMTKMHFEMNKQHYLDIGITEPKLYEVQ